MEHHPFILINKFKPVFVIMLLSFAPAFAYLTSLDGRPYITIFSPEEYGGEGQCFDITVTPDNRILVANGGGVSEFDGTQWRKIEGFSEPVVCIASDSNGIVYAGTLSDVGVIVPKKNGKLYFHSLSQEIPDSLRNQGTAWRVRTTPEGVFFQIPNLLLQWQPEKESPLKGKVTVYPMAQSKGLTLVQWVDGKLLVRQRGGTPQILKNGKFTSLPGFEGFEKIAFHHAMKFDEKGTILFTNFFGGLYLYDGVKCIPFESEVSKLTQGQLTYGSVRLDRDRLVLTCRQYGAVVYDNSGNILEIIGKDAGLQMNNASRGGVLDAQGGLWVPFEYGIARIEVKSPYRIFKGDAGLEGPIMDILIKDGRLLAGTTSNLFILKKPSAEGVTPDFTAVSENERSVWRFTDLPDYTILSTMYGMALYKPDGKIENIGEMTNNSGHPALDPSGKYLYSHSELNGIFVLELKRPKPVILGMVKNSPLNIENMLMDNAGFLWIEARRQGVAYLQRGEIAPEDPLNIVFKEYNLDNSRLDNVTGSVFLWQGNLFISSRDTVYIYDADKDMFTPASDKIPCGKLLPAFYSEAWIDEKEKLYIQAEPGRILSFNADDTNFTSNNAVLLGGRIRRALDISFYKEKMYIGSEDGRLIVYDRADENREYSAPTLLLRRIVLNSDSVIFNCGHYSEDYLKIPWKNNDLRFEFSLTAYDLPEENRYSFRLKGHTVEWSEWSREYYRDFNNLQEGKYSFEVRGKDVYGIESEIAAFRFKILPPWYRTVWAGILWLGLLISGVYGIIKLQIRRVERQKRRLQELVKEKTQELKVLSGLLPICSNCKKIRDDKGEWLPMEAYISERSDAQFSHGVCPDCLKNLYPEYYDSVMSKSKNNRESES